MTGLSTHDTKRGEDVRARLAVLSEIPEAWARFAELFLSLTIPNRPSGTSLRRRWWAPDRSIARMHAYAEKAMREASDGTTWTAPDGAYETAVHEAVDTAYDDPRLRGAWDQLDVLITHPWLVQLAWPKARSAHHARRAGRLPRH